ncbi:TM2 domain-containing protein [Toxocara canis]|uniref:TM2 domain-containing protein n=1 Tax=Toxocara canis TaxID=6265 RepID=A0A0B2VHH5_TOXCA|nr:TM2 domain-containing protein [Toxocara canis]
MVTQPKQYDALRARVWLMVGGQMGLHHLYLDEPLEAFVYFATAGLFLLGIFFDVFAIHTIVRRRNALLRQSQDREGLDERLVSCSLKRFVAQFVFGYWIGLVYGLAALFALPENRPTLLSLIIAAAVCKGVYVVGNARRQRRNLFFIWAAAFSASFVRILEMCLLRTVLFASLSATLLGNRSARAVPIGSRRFTCKTYLLLCTVYCTALLALAVGVSQRVFDRRIVVISATHHSRISSSIGLILYNRYVESQLNKSIFSRGARIEYVPVNQRRNQQTAAFNLNNAKKKESSDSWWWRELGSASSENENTLVDYLTVLTADYLRAEALARMSQRGEGKFEPARWTAWRMLAIYASGASPYISDSDLLMRCETLLGDVESSRVHFQPIRIEWKYFGVKKAYPIIRSINEL